MRSVVDVSFSAGIVSFGFQVCLRGEAQASGERFTVYWDRDVLALLSTLLRPSISGWTIIRLWLCHVAGDNAEVIWEE